MYTKTFNNEQNAIKAVKENNYKYTVSDKNYIIEANIKNNKQWVSSSTKQL